MRRPRPTLAEMDSLQRRYDAVVATMRRVTSERDDAVKRLEIMACNTRFELTVAANKINALESAVEMLTPIDVADLFRILWNGLRGRGWRR